MAQISFRVDDNVKREAEETLDVIGLSMSAAMNIFLKKIAREKRIPFELSADPFYSESNIHYLEKKMEDYKKYLSDKMNELKYKYEYDEDKNWMQIRARICGEV